MIQKLKGFFTIALVLISTFFLTNCEPVDSKDLLPNATGGPHDIFVIADAPKWKSFVGEALIKVLGKNIKGLIQPEPEFDLVNVKPNAFNDLFKKQRCLVLLVVHPKVGKARLSVTRDVYAIGQTMLKIEAPNNIEAVQLIEKNAKDISFLFRKIRGQYYQNLLFENREAKHLSKLKNKYGYSIMIPKGYQLAVEDEKFIYFSKQSTKTCDHGKHQNCYYHNGILAYSYPYEQKDNFTKDFLINVRDSITKKYVPGPDRDSVKTYIKVEPKVPPFARDSVLNDKYCYQINGWWTMENATMGGPFVSISTLDEENNRVITVEGFTFGPNFDKRSFVCELEAIARSLRY